jgi:hypothetical protein
MADNTTFWHLGAQLFCERHPLLPVLEIETAPVGKAPKPLVKAPVMGLSAVDKLSRVRYGDICDCADTFTGNCMQKRGDPLGLGRQFSLHKLKVYDHDPAQNRIPLFYLPYMQNENYRITLKNKDASETRPIEFFATEAVDGCSVCSVYVEGTRQTPTVYHINAANVKTADGKGTTGDYQNDTRAFQAKSAHMDKRFKEEGRIAKTVLLAKFGVAGVQLIQATKVENDDYMLRAPHVLDNWRNAAWENAPKRIDGHKVTDILIATQGTVFGRFKADGWHFYVQRRLQVIYLRGTQTAVGIWVTLAVKEFWPKVDGVASIANTGRVVPG